MKFLPRKSIDWTYVVAVGATIKNFGKIASYNYIFPKDQIAIKSQSQILIVNPQYFHIYMYIYL